METSFQALPPRVIVSSAVFSLRRGVEDFRLAFAVAVWLDNVAFVFSLVLCDVRRARGCPVASEFPFVCDTF